MPVFVLVVVEVAVTITVATLNSVVVVLNVSVPPFPVTVKVLVENTVIVDHWLAFLTTVGITVVVVVGTTLSVLVTVIV